MGFLRFEMNAHKPFFICGYSFQNELGFQRDGNSFDLGSSNRGESALLAENSKGDTLPWQEASNETGGFVARDFVRKVVCVIPLATVGGGKGLFGAGTSTFRQPQNRRVLRLPGREAQEFAIAESACSGIGGAAERREFRKKFLERSSITGGAKGRR